MGNNISKKNYFKEKEDLRIKAMINYDIRIREYKSKCHGNYIDYMEWCRLQYEFECIYDDSNYTCFD